MGQVCNICGKEYSNLGVHVNKAHRIPMSEYNKLYPDEKTTSDEVIMQKVEESSLKKDVVEEVKLPEADADIVDSEDTGVKVSPSVIRDGIFGEEVVYADKPLSVFLARYDVTEKELRAIMRQYKTGSTVPVGQQIKQREDIGLSEAEKLKNESNVETTSLYTAEALTTKYGFECVTVRSKKGNTPKTWVLKKK